MAAVDFAALKAPFPGDEPCGPDLDLADDNDYLNAITAVQGALPQRFFDKPEDAPPDAETKPFEPASLNFKSIYGALGPLLERRTRDLRLLGLLMQALVLERDLPGLADAAEVIANLLENFWESVNPRGEAGDFALRGIALASLNGTTTEFALQYMPFTETRRTGPISYRTVMFARGEAKPRAGETSPALSVIEQTIRDNADDVGLARANLERVRGAAKRWQAAFTDRGARDDAPTLNRFDGTLATIATFLDSVLQPQHAADDVGLAADGPSSAGEPGTPPAAGEIATAAEVRAALAAVALYFTEREPSSPVLPLVRQAQDLQGKSFFFAMQALLPDRIGSANFQIGQKQVFDLSLQRISEALGEADAVTVPGKPAPTPAWPPLTHRQQAIALLNQVALYYRRAEPSSPVPWLTERARALADQDFLSLLRTVLPASSLRDLNDQ